MIEIPINKRPNWTQSNATDRAGYGSLFLTKGMTFDTAGYLRVSYSTRAIIDDSIDADFDNPAVILFSEDYGYFVETWDEAFEVNTEILAVVPTQIATAGVPQGDIQSDAVWFGGLMVVTQDTDVDYYDPSANTWTDTNISLTNASQSQHQAVNFLSISSIAIADVNTVKIYGTPIVAAPTLITTLTISTDFHITGMVYFNQNLYVATQNRYGGHAFMYVWSGLGTAASQVYEVPSNMIFSICVHQNAVWLLIGDGELLRFNGGGFDGAETGIPAFPIYYTELSISDTTNIEMYKNIMKSTGNYLYILFSNTNNDNNRMLAMPDGIWCLDANVGLYHKYSMSNSLVRPLTIATASVNTTTNQVTVTFDFATGTEFFYRDGGGTAIPELTDEGKYYVIRVDATHIKIAATYDDAIAGTALDLTGTGNAFQQMIFYPNIDFGAYWTKRTMALNIIERPVDNTQYGVDVMWGGEVVRKDSASDRGTLGTVADKVGARGWFETPKIFSENVTDTFNLFTLKFSKMTSDLDKIIIKYRLEDDMRDFVDISEWSITWTSTTTFTTTQTEWSEAEVGNEVTILWGAGGGLLAHITAISVNAGTYTVTLDESYAEYASGYVGAAVFRNWIKWKTIEYGDSNAEQEFLSAQLGKSGKFLQIKVEVRGVKTRIEELLVDNRYRLPKQSP